MVAGRDLAAVRAAHRVDVEGVGPFAAAAGDALLDGGHDVAEERHVSPAEDQNVKVCPTSRMSELQYFN